MNKCHSLFFLHLTSDLTVFNILQLMFVSSGCVYTRTGSTNRLPDRYEALGWKKKKKLLQFWQSVVKVISKRDVILQRSWRWDLLSSHLLSSDSTSVQTTGKKCICNKETMQKHDLDSNSDSTENAWMLWNENEWVKKTCMDGWMGSENTTKV